jgi:hypothetical protein
VSRTLSYADAVRLLGGGDSKAVAAVDKLMGGLLLVASAAGGGFALSLFEPRRELAALSRALIAGLGDRMHGLGRFDRSERLAAAHAVIVLTAYFEALNETGLPFDVSELDLTKAEQVAIAAGGLTDSGRLRALATELLRTDLPMPAPQWPYEVTLAALRGFYDAVSARMLHFVSGLAVWDRIDDAARSQFREALRGSLPGRAVSCYEVMFLQLASDFPEVGFWANMVDHQATRQEVRRLSAGFAGLEQAMAGIADGRGPDTRRLALARAYRVALDRPILAAGDAPQGLRIPALGAAYVNPDFRVAQVESADRPAEDSWWARQAVRDDLQGFLLGYLTAPQATQAPLVVLGQPGSGKSVLTRVLAARLPASEYLIVRVPLRDVPADADLQTQIEHAVRNATGENLTWPGLARTAGDALPVVLLDGFDELLQATGVSQSDYVEKITDFQRREADLGRPVTVIVTSRTAVADRARFTAGVIAVRLEPFRDTQTTQWLGVWNDANDSYFTANAVDPLPPETVLAHGELASQPLLLMMLALYDADHNALQRAEGQLGHTELYERLLTRFVGREIRKTGAALPGTESEHEAERELLRLSVVAFAMFNRGRQWVTEAELDADLPLLLGNERTRHGPSGLRAALTAAQLVIGRFFFIHEAQATRDEVRLRTCEFLHATFGEYLIARLVARELDELAEVAELNATRSRPAPADDAFLHALLSFSPLTTRGSAVSFLAELLRALPAPRRTLLRHLLLGLFHTALSARPDASYADYEPVQLPVPARHATYAANLVLLAVLTAGEISTDELFPDERTDPVWPWRAIAQLWRSQLTSDGWTGLTETLAIDRGWEGSRRHIRLRLARDEPENLHIDPYWSYAFHIDPQHRPPGRSWTYSSYEHQHKKGYFICHHGYDALAHALEPLALELGTAIQTFADRGQNRPVSAAHALIRLWLTSGQDSSPDDLAAAHSICLDIALHAFSPFDNEARTTYRDLVLRQLANDRARLPTAWLRDAANQIQEIASDDIALATQASKIIIELQSTDTT